MKEVLERYTDLTGKPSLPAPWTFGLWLSTSFTTNYDEETVMSFVDGMLDRGIPLRTFHFDCFWMKEFHWTDFVWDSRVFPDPKGMLSRIKAKGLNICVWINPYIAQESCLFAEGMEKGYFVKRTNGDVWQWDMWQPGMALVDFTNPDACTWYQEKLAGLLDMGVDCFKTDFGERIPVDGIEYFDHSDAKRCTITTLTCIIRLYMIYWKRSVAKAKQCFLHVPQQSAVRSSRYTGAVTAGPIMNPWKKAYVAVCPY